MNASCQALDPPNTWRRKPPAAFPKLDESLVQPGLLDRMRLAVRDGKVPILLYGAVGSGKTGAAAVAHCRYTGSSMFVRFPEFIDNSLRVAKSGELTFYSEAGIAVEFSPSSWWHHIATVKLLVLDELAIGCAHEMRTELLWRVLEARAGRPTICTSNLNPMQLAEHFDRRIESRFLAGTLIEVLGKDRRREQLSDRVARFGETDQKPAEGARRTRPKVVS